MDGLFLLEAEPGLAVGLGGRQREEASRRLRVPVVHLSPGPWEPPAEGAGELGYMICSGMLLRRVKIEGGRSVELLGAGDCLFPWRQEPTSFSQPEWQVVDHARLAMLDLRPGAALSHWPSVAVEIAGRAIDRSRALALQSAIMSIVGTRERLSALLWALAERWGKIVPGGAELEINVPQSVLAEMVGARRPTVSQALGSLGASGLVVSSGPGQWLLRGEPPAPAAPFDR